MDGIRIEELNTMLVTNFTLSADCISTPDDLLIRPCSVEHLLIKTCNYNGLKISSHFGYKRPHGTSDKKRLSTKFRFLDHHVSHTSKLFLHHAVANAKHTRSAEALFGVKAIRARLRNEAESRKNKV